MKNKFQIFAEVTKLRITIFVTVTTMFGFIAASDSINSQIILPALGILLLACGSAALNHYQERKTDILMERTKNRPIPAGKISAKSTSQLSVALIVLGLSLIHISEPTRPY